MSEKGFTGISFPFRVGVKGGVVMSSTSASDNTHIIEAMEQILQTHPNERCMEYHFFSDIDTDIFEPNDISTHTLIAYQVEQALTALEDRVEVQDVEVFAEGAAVYVTIHFKVLKYNTIDQTTIKVGDIQ